MSASAPPSSSARPPPSASSAASPDAELKVYVGKLPVDVRDGVLEHILRELASSSSSRAPVWRRVRDPTTNAPKRFGFASFYDCESALTAMRVLDGLRARDGDDALTCTANSATRAATEAYLRVRTPEVAARALEDDARRVRVIKRMFSERGGEEDGEIGDDDAVGGAAEVDVDDAPAPAIVAVDDDGAEARVRSVVDGLPPPPPPPRLPAVAPEPETQSGARLQPRRQQRERNAGVDDELTPHPPAPRFRRQEYEANERTERLFREREKALDELVRANTRERARRVAMDKAKKAERRKALKRDLASDSDSASDEDAVLPLWERSERARARRKRFRELEMEDDAADAALEIEEDGRRQRASTLADADAAAAAATTMATSTVTTRVVHDNGAARPPPPLTSVSGFEPRRPVEETPMKMHAAFGLTGAKKSGLTAALKPKQKMFSNADDDGDDDDGDDDDDDGEDRLDGRTQRRRRLRAADDAADVASLIQRVPTAEADIFAHKIDWDVYTTAKIHRTVRKWITKKTTELLGEEEPALVDFIADKLAAAPAPDALIADLLPVLDAESRTFVLKLWRVLIFELLKATSSSA